MTQYGFYFDSTRCTGCRTCEMACKDYNDLPANYAFRRVFDYEGGDWKDNGDNRQHNQCRLWQSSFFPVPDRFVHN